MATSMRFSRPSVISLARDVVLGHLLHGPVHRLVVVRGRDDQVGHHDLVVLVHAVVVEQRAARRLDQADALVAALALDDQVGALQVRVVQQLLIFSIECSSSIMRAQW